jgi:uncharacterized protein
VGKVIFWLVVVFIVLFALRLVNASKHRARNGQRAAPRDSAVGAMARCVDCGVYLPSADATAGPRGPLCGDAKCLERAGIGGRKSRD